MWRYDVRNISEQQFRLLRFLAQHRGATAHIVVKSEQPWPREIVTYPRQPMVKIVGDAIN